MAFSGERDFKKYSISSGLSGLFNLSLINIANSSTVILFFEFKVADYLSSANRFYNLNYLYYFFLRKNEK